MHLKLDLLSLIMTLDILVMYILNYDIYSSSLPKNPNPTIFRLRVIVNCTLPFGYLIHTIDCFAFLYSCFQYSRKINFILCKKVPHFPPFEGLIDGPHFPNEPMHYKAYFLLLFRGLSASCIFKFPLDKGEKEFIIFISATFCVNSCHPPCCTKAT